MMKFNAGQELQSTVVLVSGDTVFIDLGLKSEGFVDKSEFLDAEGNCSVKEGDSITVFFIGKNMEDLHFTTKLHGKDAGIDLLKNAFENKIPVEGKVEKEIKGGFEVKLGNSRAFCPYSQMGYKNRLEPAEYIGRTVKFLINEFKNEGKNIIVSNRLLEENAEIEQLKSFSQKYSEGDIVSGTVKSIQSYGAFVELDGFQALLPVSEISRQRVEKIEDFIVPGQKIKAKIIRCEWNPAHLDRSKISLSLKELQEDPWNSVSQKLSSGEKYSGKIVRIASFGIFVNLLPGIDGLVHISELKDISSGTNLNKKFQIGQVFDVVVLKVDEAEKRISLAPASSKQQDEDANSYLNAQNDSDGETYNPFAALLSR